MYFIDFLYTKMSVYNSSINTGVTFTKLFWLGLHTASHRTLQTGHDSSFVQRLDSLQNPMGTKASVKRTRGSELMTPALYSLIYIVMERSV